MKKQLFFAICIVLIGSWIWFKSEKPTKLELVATEKETSLFEEKDPVETKKQQLLTKQIKIPTLSNTTSTHLKARTVAAASEVENITKMANILLEFMRPNVSIEALENILQNSGQEPFRMTDKNPYTGEMVVLRTNSPLNGTRYFHAQYFSNDGKNGTVQHVSFEVKAGPTAMSESVDTFQKTFQLSKPAVERDGYVKWNLQNNKILWIKKLMPGDLQINPFNAYTPEDTGTIRIAIEEEIHGDD